MSLVILLFTSGWIRWVVFYWWFFELYNFYCSFFSAFSRFSKKLLFLDEKFPITEPRNCGFHRFSSWNCSEQKLCLGHRHGHYVWYRDTTGELEMNMSFGHKHMSFGHRHGHYIGYRDTTGELEINMSFWTFTILFPSINHLHL